MRRKHVTNPVEGPDEIGDLFDEGAHEPRQILALTDAELLSLEGVDTPTVAPYPLLKGAGEAQREFAARLGAASLAARELSGAVVSPAGEAAGYLGGRARAVLAMRRTASEILLAEQQTSAGRAVVVAYLHGTLGAMVEEVNSGGVHRFISCTVGHSLTMLRDWADPLDQQPRSDGPSRLYDRARWADEADQELSGARAVTVMVGTSTAPGASEVVEQKMTVYCLPDRLEAAQSFDGGQTLNLVPVARESLLSRIADLVGR